MNFIDLISRPWPWYVAGPLIGLTVPTLLILGNKSFGISSTLRHACAACLPAKIPFFQYDWKKEIWNMVFVLGIFIGAVIASIFLSNPNDMIVHPELLDFLSEYGIQSKAGLVPTDLFSWSSLFTLRGFVMMVVGGFMIGFGTRYGGGCTSGHTIMGLSTLQWPSLIATCCFMIGGFIMTHIFLPYILAL
jgi:uncharacterized protein